MSSSRYIQKVYASDESSVGEDSATQSARQVTEVFRAGEAISQGDAVCFDLSQSTIAQMFAVVKKLDDGAANTSVFCGVAAEDIASGDFGKVIVEGLSTKVSVDSAVAKGDYLILSSNAGELATQDEVTLTVDGSGNLAATGLTPVSQVVLAGGSAQAVKCAIALEAAVEIPASSGNYFANAWVLKSY